VRELRRQELTPEELEDAEESGFKGEWVPGDIVIDVEKPDDRIVLAKGGMGGRGNFSFMTPSNRSPKNKELGKIGEERALELELKTIADVGFVGYPNAGKSTLLSKLSNAKPKIMPYPFTTLWPYVGVLEIDEFKRITIADLPGIIEGAHEDKGLGLDFLRHIERTKVLCYLVDMAGTERKYPWRDYISLLEEVGHYNSRLLWRPSIILANKMDLPTASENLEIFKQKIEAHLRKARRVVPPIFPITAKTGTDLEPVVRALARMVTAPAIARQRPKAHEDDDGGDSKE